MQLILKQWIISILKKFIAIGVEEDVIITTNASSSASPCFSGSPTIFTPAAAHEYTETEASDADHACEHKNCDGQCLLFLRLNF